MWWLLITIPLYLAAFATYPNHICGCCFHADALIPATPPTLWGFYLLLRYRTGGERVLSYVCVVLSIFWLFMTWGSNVMFFFVYR